MKDGHKLEKFRRRIQELKQMKDGWLDGGGKAPDKDGLDWFCDFFKEYYPDELPLPDIYPTIVGGIYLEWVFGEKNIDLEVVLVARRGELLILDILLGVEFFEKFDLILGENWLAWINRVSTVLSDCR